MINRKIKITELGQAYSSLGEKAGFAAPLPQTYPELILDDWRRACPGNNPLKAESGLTAFRRAIEDNLQRSAVDKIR